jgi:Holliday junction resolvase RusA-like endonuclease
LKYPRNKVDSQSAFRVIVNFNFDKKIVSSDLDNLIKTFCDALNGLLWADDKQVYRIEAQREWGHPSPMTEAWIDRA